MRPVEKKNATKIMYILSFRFFFHSPFLFCIILDVLWKLIYRLPHFFLEKEYSRSGTRGAQNGNVFLLVWPVVVI